MKGTPEMTIDMSLGAPQEGATKPSNPPPPVNDQRHSTPPPEPQLGSPDAAREEPKPPADSSDAADKVALQVAIQGAKNGVLASQPAASASPDKADDEGGETIAVVPDQDLVLVTKRLEAIKGGRGTSIDLFAKIMVGLVIASIFAAVLLIAYLTRNIQIGILLFALLTLVGALVVLLARGYSSVIHGLSGTIVKMGPMVEGLSPLKTEKRDLMARVKLLERSEKRLETEVGRRIKPETARVILGQAPSRNERLMLRTVRRWTWAPDRKSGKLGKLINFFDARFAAKTALHFVFVNKNAKEEFYSVSLPTGAYAALNFIFDVNAEDGTVTVFKKKMGVWDFADETSKQVLKLDTDTEVGSFKCIVTATGIGHIAAICSLLKDLINDKKIVSSRTIHAEVDEGDYEESLEELLGKPSLPSLPRQGAAIGPPPPVR